MKVFFSRKFNFIVKVILITKSLHWLEVLGGYKVSPSPYYSPHNFRQFYLELNEAYTKYLVLRFMFSTLFVLSYTFFFNLQPFTKSYLIFDFFLDNVKGAFNNLNYSWQIILLTIFIFISMVEPVLHYQFYIFTSFNFITLSKKIILFNG